MIIGLISFSSPVSDSSEIEFISRASDTEGLSFNSVIHRYFTGGYFLHRHLPYYASDFYYFDKVNDILVLLSGSIYNKTELYSLLNIAAPIPDPELISWLFVRGGSDFVKKLNGDFAFLILSPEKQEAYLFRDHVGIRPLAFTIDRQTLTFSTDEISLSTAFEESGAIDTDYLTGYFRFTDYVKTPDVRVRKLPPGHFIRFTAKELNITKYWEPEEIKTDKKLSYEQMLSDLKLLMEDAVKIRCEQRFIAGSHVSSGLDSGIVATLARKEYSNQERFYGFSWSPADFNAGDVNYDEREIITETCDRTNIIPLFSDMRTDEFQRIVSSFYYNHGFFSEDRTAQQAVKAGVNLIFSGWGGDEFISTGDRAIELDLLTGLRLKTFFRRNSLTHPKRFIKNFFHFVLYPALGIIDGKTLRSFREDARYLKKQYKRNDKKAIRNFYFHTSRQQMHLRMLHLYHLQHRCEHWMINGYRNGLEYRYPLLDKRIVEYMLRVPSILLCRTNDFRPVLREIAKDVLPDAVRLHVYKNDPVYWRYMDEKFREASLILTEEAGEWSANSDLHFIDFKLLKEDISKYRYSPESINAKSLFRGLVYIKAVHEFTKRYHENRVRAN